MIVCGVPPQANSSNSPLAWKEHYQKIYLVCWKMLSLKTITLWGAVVALCGVPAAQVGHPSVGCLAPCACLCPCGCTVSNEAAHGTTT